MRRAELPIVAFAWSMACAGPAQPASSALPSTAPAVARGLTAHGAAAEDEGGGHEHEAPHRGSLIELGQEFAHVELVLDADRGVLTVYALDGEAEHPIRLVVPALRIDIAPPERQRITLTLAAVPNVLTGETVGDTSQFQSSADALKGLSRFTGVIPSLTIKGRTFSDVAFTYPAEH